MNGAHCGDPDRSVAHTVGLDQESSRQDDALLHICARFQTIDSELDRLVECDVGAPEEEFLSLHMQWTQAILQASCLPARTSEGLRAKAAMLLAALGVALGSDLAPHELLAASVGRDVAG